MNTDVQDDRQALLGAIEAAGALAMEYFRRQDAGDLKTQQKSDGSLYSDADLAVNELLRQRLRTHAPDYGWLSEEDEDGTGRLEKSRVWIVDPIDGSRAFLRGDREFAICVCLVEDGAPILAAIHVPAMSESYFASREQGAWCNGARLPVRAPMPSAGLSDCSLLTTGRVRRIDFWRELLGLEGDTQEPRLPGSIAYRLMLVARGDFDATLSMTQKWEWDLAAAHLIATESGVKVTAREGSTLCYNESVDSSCDGVLAAPVGLHERLAERVREGLAREAS